MDFDSYDYTRENCSSCKAINDLTKANVWVHSGFGVLEKEQFLKQAEKQFIIVSETMNLSNLLPYPNIFLEREKKYTKPKPLNAWLGGKPTDCIWFSRGGWIHRIFGEYDHCGEEESDIDLQPVVAVQNPKNIYTIENMEGIDQFVEEYQVPKEKNPLSDLHTSIDWERLQKEGYWGFVIDIQEIRGLALRNTSKYLWAHMFDVESLCVWDNRAFGDDTYLCTLNLSN